MKSPATLSCFVLLVAGCGAPRTVAVRRPPALAAPVPSVTASAESAAPAPSGARVAPAPGVPKKLVELLGNVCQLVSRPMTDSNPAQVGCACCAPFDECKPTDPPFDAYVDAFAPADVVGGSFTRRGADQRAVPMLGCEPHSYNSGGLLLLERGTEGFFVQRYLSGFFADECTAVHRSDGRDLLLCRRGDVHQGNAAQLIFQWDLGASDAELEAVEPLFVATDDEQSGCTSPLLHPVSSTEITLRSIDSVDGEQRLTIHLDVREGVVTKAFLARCHEQEQQPLGQATPTSRRPRALLRGRTERVVFRFDGSSFKPSAALH